MTLFHILPERGGGGVNRTSFSRMDSGLCIYHLFVWSYLNFLHNSERITSPTQSYLILCSFCANLQHSLIMWLIVSSVSPHNLHLLFCCVQWIFAQILLVLMAFFCATVRIDYYYYNLFFTSFSLLRNIFFLPLL